MVNLASLPYFILHKILDKVATNHLPDFGSARIAFFGFNEIGRDGYFYRYADLFHLNDWIHEVNTIRTFMLKCYEQGNLEAIYLQGMYEFFLLHLLDEGREKIRLAGERGFSLTKYVDGMFGLAFSIDDRWMVQNYPSFSHAFAERMHNMMNSSVFAGHWSYQKSETILIRIHPNLSCCCLNAPWTWTCNHCYWQCEAWKIFHHVHLIGGHSPIED